MHLFYIFYNIFYSNFHWSIAAAPTGQLSDSAVAAIASTISIISFLIILILASIGIFSIVKYNQNRRQKVQFNPPQSISLSDIQSTGEERFTEIEDEKKDLVSTSISLSGVSSTGEEHFTEIEDEKIDLVSTWKDGHILSHV